MANRSQVRAAKALERKVAAGAPWPDWRTEYFPKGSVSARGWGSQIDRAFTNGVHVCLCRLIDGEEAGRVHLAIRTISNAEPPWRDLQRIKNELFGPERLAVQVYPADSRLIDQADMYHLFILPTGTELGFGLHSLDEPSEKNQ